jgi:hypothetical protein
VYGEHAMISSVVWRYVQLFNEGHKSVHDDLWSGRPSVVKEYLLHAFEEKIRENRRFTIMSLSLHFPEVLPCLPAVTGIQRGQRAITTASFYNEGIQKLVQRCNKCMNNGGNCVEN